MAKRTPEQNRAIYQRRSERAKAQGTSYGKIKYQQDKIRRQAVEAFRKVGAADPAAKVKKLTPEQRKIAAKGPEAIRDAAAAQGKYQYEYYDDEDEGTDDHENPFWYHE